MWVWAGRHKAIKKHGQFSPTRLLQTVEFTITVESAWSTLGNLTRFPHQNWSASSRSCARIVSASIAAGVVACVIRAGRGCLNGRSQQTVKGGREVVPERESGRCSGD
jgi:hypothetical protein